VKTLSDTKVRVSAGKFHDITVGSLLELYANPEDTLVTRRPKRMFPDVAWLAYDRERGNLGS